jgi:hypothetical protein
MPPESLDSPFPSQQQSAGDIAIPGSENVTAFVTAAGNAAIDQSRHVIYNYYYYREESRSVAVSDTPLPDDLPCPYRGLFHFGPEDAEFFFGRDVFVAELVNVVQTRALVPVLGASGSGKSSVVLAGLVPRLRQTGHWQFTHFRPGNDPFHALALALVPLYQPAQDATDQIAQARKLASYLRDGEVLLADVIARIQQNYPNQRVLLIADQFEELYTLCSEEVTRRRFLDCLLSSLATANAQTSPLVLVATMRADFLANALSYRPFADVLQNGDVKLGVMNQEELRQVIAKPAAKLGVAFEAGLVQRILDGVESQPGNLPLLEFALTELWGRRNGKQLTHAAYEAIGEVEGALAGYADQQYARLSQSEQAQVRRIFVQLVRPGEGTEDTRRLATKAELGEERWALVTRLANSRLVVTSQDGVKQETVEVVHEALIRNWGELRGWMASDRTFRVWQDRLRAAMQQWQATQGDEGSLLRGAALVEAEEKLKVHQDDLSPAEQTFIQKSVELRNRLLQEEKFRQTWRIAGVALIPLAVLMTWEFRNLIFRPESPFVIEPLKSVNEIKDAKPSDPYFQPLKSLIEKYKISPPLYSDRSFHSDDHISRAQLIVYFANLWNELIKIRNSAARSQQCRLPDTARKHPFNPPKDVTLQTAWYYEAYKNLAEQSGLGNQHPESQFFPLADGQFHSDLSLTRAEMTAAVTRLLNAFGDFVAAENQNSNKSELSSYRSSYVPVVYPNPLLAQITSIVQFSDVKTTDWFFPDFQSLLERYGIFPVGMPDGTFQPNRLATRGELVELLNNAMRAMEFVIVPDSDQCSNSN